MQLKNNLLLLTLISSWMSSVTDFVSSFWIAFVFKILELVESTN